MTIINLDVFSTQWIIVFEQLSKSITKLGSKDFGAPKLKLGFTAQNIRSGIRRRL